MAEQTQDLARELRNTRKYLRGLTKTLRICVREIDTKVATRKDIPADLSEWFGHLANTLEMENDIARHFGLGEKLSSQKKG